MNVLKEIWSLVKDSDFWVIFVLVSVAFGAMLYGAHVLGIAARGGCP